MLKTILLPALALAILPIVFALDARAGSGASAAAAAAAAAQAQALAQQMAKIQEQLRNAPRPHFNPPRPQTPPMFGNDGMGRRG